MMYFVNYVQTYVPKNMACKKLVDFVPQFKHVLIQDKDGLNHLRRTIENKVEEINSAHPKMKRIKFSMQDFRDGTIRYEASIENSGSSGVPNVVCFINICTVQNIYSGEGRAIEKGGAS
jgi:hypothetical protein